MSQSIISMSQNHSHIILFMVIFTLKRCSQSDAIIMELHQTYSFNIKTFVDGRLCCNMGFWYIPGCVKFIWCVIIANLSFIIVSLLATEPGERARVEASEARWPRAELSWAGRHGRVLATAGPGLVTGAAHWTLVKKMMIAALRDISSLATAENLTNK